MDRHVGIWRRGRVLNGETLRGGGDIIGRSVSEQRRCVLLLAYAFPPENVVGAARPYRFAKYLPECGYDVEVLAGGLHGQPDKPISLHRLSSEPGLWEKVLMKGRVLPGDDGLSWIPRAVRLAKRLVVERGISVVLSTYPPAAGHIVALKLKQTLPVRWVADFRDPLVGNPVMGYKWSIHKRAEKLLEESIFRHADSLVAVTDVVADEWRTRWPEYGSKVHVLPNGFDPEEAFIPAPPPERPYRVIAHVGSLYGARVPTILLASIRRLIQTGRISPGRVRIRLLGDTDLSIIARERELWEDLQRLGVLWYNPVSLPKQEAQQEIAQADSLLLIDLSYRTSGHTVPAKLFEYVVTGRPILTITMPDSPVERILSQCGLQTTCLYGNDPDCAVDEKLLQFVNAPAVMCTPSTWFATQFDGRRQTQALSEILDRVCA